jgi:NAD(P)-dependent dehydrogenase (short-subunit alcohol dehydrogenase family)
LLPADGARLPVLESVMQSFVAPSRNLTRTVLITGATGGLGCATAGRFLASGACVLLHAPSPSAAQAAAEHLVAQGADPARVRPVAADFSRLDEVAALAERVSISDPGLDTLVLNAAVAGPESRRVTGDGNELTFQVNYLAPALVTRLLTPALQAVRGRVLMVSSHLHRSANINWSDPQRTKLYAPLPAYAQSKLALTMFARAFGEQHADITAVSVHPGVIRGGLLPLYARTGADPDEAAATLVRLAQPQVHVLDGAYYDGLVPAVPAALVDNAQAVRRLWKLTTAILGQQRFLPALAG